jgi:hypothetical protein
VRVSSLCSALLLVAWSALLGGPARAVAQPGPVPPARESDSGQVRYQISVMEGVLERAVEHGARVMSQRVQSVIPETLLWGTAAQARGFRLDGYGVFFDVEVPALRRSVAWSVRMLGQGDGALTSALKSLRDHVQSLGDRQARAQLEQALRRVELQVNPVPAAEDWSATKVNSADASPVPPVDPNDAYTVEVKNALADAMLDHGGSIQVGPDEWLTIAARDNEVPSGLAPDEPYDVMTIVLKIRGSDLVALRAGRLTREEARKRIDVTEF